MRRYGYLAGLVLLIAGIASAFGYYYHLSETQVRVSAGEAFPFIRVEGLNLNKQQCLIVVKKGCVHCQILKANLDTLFFENPEWREQTTFLAIDEPLNELGRDGLIFHSAENELSFTITPQIFFLNERGIVLKKHLGVITAQKLKRDFETHLKVAQVQSR